MDQIVTVDVGNTQSCLGIWRNNELVETLRLSTDPALGAEEWLLLIRPWLEEGGGSFEKGAESVVISSVVPKVDSPLKEAFQEAGAGRVAFIQRGMKFPFQFEESRFPTIGLDRLAAAAAGVEIWGPNLLIVDFGTAITFCLILNGEYCGGTIAPGIHSSIDCLAKKAANLPEISYRKKSSALGCATAESIENGIYYGWKGLVKEIKNELLGEAKKRGVANVTVAATGGISAALGYSHEMFDIVDPLLTLRGIAIIAGLNGL